jgi:predicted TIM-barrel fold metal-dependent hydrolase
LIIDADTHWEVDGLPPAEHPLAPWSDQFPDDAGFLADAIAGDLLAALPPADRPDPRELLAGLVALGKEHFGGEVRLQPIHRSEVTARVAWMDSVGIDHCLVNPGAYWLLLARLDPSELAAGVRRCNDFLTEQLECEAGRLHAVATVDLRDIDGAVVELERARRRGARAFFLTTANGKPPAPEAYGHPDWDKVWSAAVDLGMIPTIHVGNAGTDFTRWANIGWNRPGGAGVEGLVRLANTQRVHATQNIIASLLCGGSFERVPALTVLISEIRVGWLPWFVGMLEMQSRPSPALGEWPWDTPGGDMLRRNVRITPLPGLGDLDALEVVAALPEMCVFSSDYPHGEGNAKPVELYGDGLDRLGEPLRGRFMGRNLEDCFARMGDPL